MIDQPKKRNVEIASTVLANHRSAGEQNLGDCLVVG